jgi:ABC-2 type transport system permease protein
MRAAFTIAGRELRATFGSSFGYGLVAGFLVLSGVVLDRALAGGEARLDGWFAPLFILCGVLAALLTMRAFAEEERTGSLELLVTAPVRPWHVVVGKLLGVVAVFAVVLAATVPAPLLVAAMGNPDGGPILTGYLGILLAGTAFLAVGLAASSVTASQLVAAAVSIGVLLGLWFGAGVAQALHGPVGRTLVYLSPSTHVNGFLRGTIALTDVVYFVSFAALGVLAAVTIVRERR